MNKQKVSQIKPSEIKSHLILAKSQLEIFSERKKQIISRNIKNLQRQLEHGDIKSSRLLMKNILEEIDNINVYKTIITLIKELMKSNMNFVSQNQPPIEMQKHFNSLVFAASHLNVKELNELKNIFGRLFGNTYLNSVETNKKGSFIMENLLEIESNKNKSDNLIDLKLKAFCQVKTIYCDYFNPNQQSQHINNNADVVQSNSPQDLQNKEQHIQEEYQRLQKSNLIASKFLIRRDIVQEKATLSKMGYINELIHRVYLLLKPKSLEEAITYMTFKDGRFLHNFYNTSQRNNFNCFVCGLPREVHQDWDGQQSNQNNPSSYIVKESVLDSTTCVICMENMEPKEIRRLRPPCKHVICFECIYGYLEDKIKEASVVEISCFAYQCKEILSHEYIIDKIKDNQELVDKYTQFKKKKEIQNDPNKKFCPHPNCQSFLPKEIGKKYVTCEEGHQYCFMCIQPWHKGKPCAEIVDKDFQLWAKDKVIKRCPNCKFYIEKNKGCNHIKCQQCKYNFCWLCLGEYRSSNHYSSGQCEGLWFADINYLEEAKPK